jgi:hypothetical protein
VNWKSNKVIVAVALALGVAVGILAVNLVGGGRSTPVAAVTPSASPTFTMPSTTGTSPEASPSDSGAPTGQFPGGVQCPIATVNVDSSGALTAALKKAPAGSVISLAPGTYSGNFVATGSGTAAQPIFLCGPSTAVLDGGDPSKGYGLYLDHVAYWRVVGLTVQNSQKGVVADAASNCVVQAMTVQDIGDEGIHLRRNSTVNLVIGNTIRRTGLHKAKFGEGIYIGSAVKNWCTYTGCQPDRSDRNIVAYNNVSDTGAESVDIKEGTTGGIIKYNVFSSGRLTSGATSWVNVKGNDYTILGNHGTNAPEDGFTTHVIVDGWGRNNVFSLNVADVNAGGFGIHITGGVPNRVLCNNVVTNAASGLTNIQCG